MRVFTGIRGRAGEGGTLGYDPAKEAALLQDLRKDLRGLLAADRAHADNGLAHVLALANNNHHADGGGAGEDEGSAAFFAHALAQHAGLEFTFDFEFIVTLLLSKHGPRKLQQLNPLLSDGQVNVVTQAALGVLLRVSRVGHTVRPQAS